MKDFVRELNRALKFKGVPGRRGGKSAASTSIDAGSFGETIPLDYFISRQALRSVFERILG